jgi:hypothetical protein
MVEKLRGVAQVVVCQSEESIVFFFGSTLTPSPLPARERGTGNYHFANSHQGEGEWENNDNTKTDSALIYNAVTSRTFALCRHRG